jgi:hypothetical protein
MPAWKSVTALVLSALVMMLGTFLPWVSYEENAPYGETHEPPFSWNGFNTVVMTKYDLDGRPRGSFGNMGIPLPLGVRVSAGFLIVACCAGTVLVAALRRPRWAIAFGAVGVVLGVCMFLRIAGDVVAAGESHLNGSMGLGIWLVLAGAVLVILGGLLAPGLDGGKKPDRENAGNQASRSARVPGRP